ncbi:MAG: hypothetical protein JRJ59_03880 [Deltaproteobacteria bacterium]|nr:hypothetical protein [Deltaproteobacteria bacterium]
MNRCLIAVVLAGLIGLALAWPAAAASPTFSAADFQGRWQLHGINVTSGGVYSTLFYGTLEMDGNGDIVSGSLFFPEQGGAGSVNSGSFSVTVQGALSGQVTYFDSAANNDFAVVDGRMSLDKNTITLIGRLVTSSGGVIYGKWTLTRIP